MSVQLPSSEGVSSRVSRTVVNRKLKAHKKSRRGCRNCKLRSVKCDESKPRCTTCTSYGVFCSYDGEYSDLQLSLNGAFSTGFLQQFPYSQDQISPSLMLLPSWHLSMGSVKSSAGYQLHEQDLELLSKFRSRTVLTISTKKSLPIYQNEIIKLAFSNPFLMHAILCLTLMHDRHLSATPDTSLSPSEAFHWHQGTALFSSKLSGLIQPSERDALWATAALLGITAFYHIEAKTPREAWPLKPPSSMDLNWLKMSAGKNEIWRIAEPLRADSVFRALALDHQNFLPSCPTGPGPDSFPAGFFQVYAFDTASTQDNNPYHAAVSSLARSLSIDNKPAIILQFLSFVNSIRQDFKELLERKDPRAILLLAYWFAKVCQCQQWWIWRRAALECQAICLYLEKYYLHEVQIQELLQFPKSVCGIAPC